VPRWNWEIEVKGNLYAKEVFNSDDKKYWGTGDVFNTTVRHEIVNKDEKKYRIIVNLPPLAGIVLK
jgi:1,4-alpha-glucan branching enzyme